MCSDLQTFFSRFELGVAEESKRQSIIQEAPSKFRVLLVDDNDLNQKVARRVLEKAGHVVQSAVNGREAVNQWKSSVEERQLPDIILMDIQMPVLDGIQATQEIRSYERDITAEGGKLPSVSSASSSSSSSSSSGVHRLHQLIYAMTAHTEESDKMRCLEAGMDGYIEKPFKPLDLLRTIEEGILQHRLLSHPSS
jgi:protein-histidine pros-kinase